MDIEKLIKKAIENKKNAYVPYSNFHVSSIVITEDGSIYEGVNIENASYPATLCAERSAISSAITAGHKRINTIIITGDSEYTYPCGICRQVMSEFMDENSKIIIAKNEKDYKQYTLDEILPMSFNKEDLKEE
ncbi:MAG: cytidine deaminase [Tissierellia bacterium]|nr:cytidine deaminase [Tissierellia bacterium]